MAFAEIKSDLSYWQKQSATSPLYADLAWNLPEQKTGHVAVIGGNINNFVTPIRVSETLANLFPIETVSTILPDAIEKQLPPLPNLIFTPSTTSGSFAKSAKLRDATSSVNASLIIGDLSRNAETAIAIADTITAEDSSDDAHHLLVIARDSVDLLAPEATRWLNRPNTIVIASILQLQKLLRSIYYPRMILLSQSLIAAIETLHKFTLTYPVTLLTFHQDVIIVAKDGQIVTTKITDTDYSPISLWSGELAAKITGLNLYNPHHPLEATTAAITYH